MTNPPQLQALIDRADITAVIIAAANAFDAQDWERLRQCLADELHTDYSEFRGEATCMVSADAYVEARRRGLTGLRTLHLSTNHEIQLKGDEATCRSTYRIYRVNPALPINESRLDTAGHYDHGLVRTPQGWRITSIRQTVVLREGNTQAHGAFRAASK